MCRHELAQLRKRRVLERKPHLVGEAPPPGRDGFGITVDREHAARSTQGLENACRVPTAPERRIDIVTIRLEGQSRQRLFNEHRRVLVLSHVIKRLETAPELLALLPDDDSMPAAESCARPQGPAGSARKCHLPLNLHASIARPL